jgi:uncharacterized protein involved in exopolysaccharide biosynthesis
MEEHECSSKINDSTSDGIAHDSSAADLSASLWQEMRAQRSAGGTAQEGMANTYRAGSKQVDSGDASDDELGPENDGITRQDIDAYYRQVMLSSETTLVQAVEDALRDHRRRPRSWDSEPDRRRPRSWEPEWD